MPQRHTDAGTCRSLAPSLARHARDWSLSTTQSSIRSLLWSDFPFWLHISSGCICISPGMYSTSHPTHLRRTSAVLLYHFSATPWAPSSDAIIPSFAHSAQGWGMRRGTGVTVKLASIKNMAREVDHGRDCSNQFLPDLCVFA